MEHSISAHGNSLDGHHLKEMVRDGNSGQTRVLREVMLQQPHELCPLLHFKSTTSRLKHRDEHTMRRHLPLGTSRIAFSGSDFA